MMDCIEEYFARESVNLIWFSMILFTFEPIEMPLN